MNTRVHSMVIGACLVMAAAIGAASAQRRDDPTLVSRADGRSLVVYPAQRIALRMDHSHPEHRELPCTRCHERATTSEAARDTLVPAETTCLPCHADDTARESASPATCGTCHVGYGEGGSAVVRASELPTPNLRFSHRAHASESCERCHQGVRDARLATRAHLPTMQQCFECHAPAGLGDVATTTSTSTPSTCATCHLTSAGGMLRTRFESGWMNPPRWMAGMHHDHEWLVRHRWVAADQGPLCAQCHTESECAACHDGRVRPSRIHPGDFLTTHPVMARRDGTRCTSCHTATQFCAECHSRLGLATISAPDVRSPERYHPPPAVWTRGPTLHGIEARRSMQSCASCHAEDDCVACHGASGVGGTGVSPHPAGFRAQCRVALEANARACITCHGDDLESLRARCE